MELVFVLQEPMLRDMNFCYQSCAKEGNVGVSLCPAGCHLSHVPIVRVGRGFLSCTFPRVINSTIGEREREYQLMSCSGSC